MLSVPKFAALAIKSAECALCKYVVTYLDAVLQNNKSEAAIDAALEKVCGILPATIKANCIKFVDTYGPILAQLLVKYATPDQVCNALKVCNNGTQESVVCKYYNKVCSSSEFLTFFSSTTCAEIETIGPVSKIGGVFSVQVCRHLLGCRSPE